MRVLWMKFLTVYKSIWRNRKELKWGAVFLTPGFKGVMVFYCIPFLDVINRSFCQVLSEQFVGYHNYQLVIANQAFLLAVKNTLRFTVVCLPLLLGISLYLAYGLSFQKYRNNLKSIYLIPMALPIAAVVVIWKLLFCRQGILNVLLNAAGLDSIDFLGSNASFWVLVVTYLWKNLGYTVVLWLAGIMGISEEIIEAAKVDGAGERTCFFKIVLPNLKGVLYTITILSLINSFKVFREAYLVAGPYPNENMYLLQHLFNNWYTNLEMDKLAAGAVMVATVLVLLILLLQFLWDRKDNLKE